jgi:hypothetical protein
VATGHLINDELLRLIRQMIQSEQRRSGNTGQRPGGDLQEGWQASDVYVALTPAGGIPALAEGPDTGTGLGEGDKPGGADCRIHRLLLSGTDRRLYDSGFTRTVYNLSQDDVPGSIWVAIVKDKYGDWLVVSPGALGGVGITDYEDNYRDDCIGGIVVRFVQRKTIVDGRIVRKGQWEPDSEQGCCACAEPVGTGTGTAPDSACCGLGGEDLCCTLHGPTWLDGIHFTLSWHGYIDTMLVWGGCGLTRCNSPSGGRLSIGLVLFCTRSSAIAMQGGYATSCASGGAADSVYNEFTGLATSVICQPLAITLAGQFSNQGGGAAPCQTSAASFTATITLGPCPGDPDDTGTGTAGCQGFQGQGSCNGYCFSKHLCLALSSLCGCMNQTVVLTFNNTSGMYSGSAGFCTEIVPHGLLTIVAYPSGNAWVIVTTCRDVDGTAYWQDSSTSVTTLCPPDHPFSASGILTTSGNAANVCCPGGDVPWTLTECTGTGTGTGPVETGDCTIYDSVNLNLSIYNGNTTPGSGCQACLSSPVGMSWLSTGQWQGGSTNPCGSGGAWSLTCFGGAWILELDGVAYSPTTVTWSPLQVVFEGLTHPSCAGTFSVMITE